MSLRNDGSNTYLPVLETGLQDSNCISVDQKSNDLRPIQNETFLRMAAYIEMINCFSEALRDTINSWNFFEFLKQ